MKIIAMSNNLTAQGKFELVSPEVYGNMRDKVGTTIVVSAFILYSEEDQFGRNKNVLSIKEESGEIVVSASSYLTRDFEKMLLIFGADSIKYLAIKETQLGNDSITCGYGEKPEVKQEEKNL